MFLFVHWLDIVLRTFAPLSARPFWPPTTCESEEQRKTILTLTHWIWVRKRASRLSYPLNKYSLIAKHGTPHPR